MQPLRRAILLVLPAVALSACVDGAAHASASGCAFAGDGSAADGLWLALVIGAGVLARVVRFRDDD